MNKWMDVTENKNGMIENVFVDDAMFYASGDNVTKSISKVVQSFYSISYHGIETIVWNLLVNIHCFTTIKKPT